MNDSFRLPSLHLGTAFDVPSQRHVPPVTIDHSVGGAIALIDGAVRAPHRLARVVRPSGLVGIEIEPPTAPTLVAVDLRVDEWSDKMWLEHADDASGPRDAVDAGGATPDLAHRTRVVRVTAQGHTVAAVALSLLPSDGGAVRQRVRFWVEPDQVGADGLLIIGLESVEGPAAGADAIMPDSAVGVAVVRIVLDPGTGGLKPFAAVGRHDKRGGKVVGATAVAVVNPGVDDSGFSFRVGVRGPAGERLVGRRQQVQHPLAAVQQRVRDRRLDRDHGITIRVCDLEGADVATATIDGTRVSLPAHTGPVLVLLDKRTRSGDPEHVEWSVRAERDAQPTSTPD